MQLARFQRSAALAKLSSMRSAEILYEYVWRSERSFEPLDKRIIADLEKFADPERQSGLGKSQQLELTARLLRHARESEDEARFNHWAQVIEAHSEPDTDLRAYVTFQRCLRARDNLDLEQLGAQLNKLAGPDPIWKLRRAALHCELCQFSEANTLIAEARSELMERQRRDNRSLWIRSRLAWAERLFGAAHGDWRVSHTSPWADEFRQWHCDPETEINSIEVDAADRTRKHREEQVRVIPLFEPGHYRDPSKTIRFGDIIETPLGTLSQLLESAGSPIWLNGFDMVGHVKNDALSLALAGTFQRYALLIRYVHHPADQSFVRYFQRIQIAILAADVASALSERLALAVAYWRGKVRSAKSSNSADWIPLIERLVLYIEALSRLTPRQQQEGARRTFELAMDIAHNPLHHWLIEPIQHLAQYGAQAIPRADQGELALVALECPLSVEKGGVQGPWPWVNPIEIIFNARPSRPDGDGRWTKRVDHLIREARADGASRTEAVLRLYYLSK